MLSINTNLSSSIVQANLTNSTNGLNKAIERLSTGYKINHASDNAANYSIANSYEAKLSSYDMAASNVSMGMDLLAVAQDTISSMQDHGARLHALITQARNGTYGAQSLTALTQEAGALISEIQRMYSNAEYNNVSLFDNSPVPAWVKEVEANAGTNLEPKYNGFIADAKTYTDEQVAAMTKVEDVESFTSGQKYSISSKEELQKLATKVNGGANTTNVEFVLANDIDLSSIENWDAIGTDYSHSFKGTFDGNGHTIKNLKIDKSTTNNQGLFGYTSSGSEIKNIGIVNCDVKGKDYTGGLVGLADRCTITNSYATGSVSGTNYTGGLVGHASSSGTITNSYATGSVTGTGHNTGGLVGDAYNSTVTNSYATGSVTGNSSAGGLVGYADRNSTVTNSYATGAVSGTGKTGGLVGGAFGAVTNSYATGSVNGTYNTGGLVGYASGTVTNSYATGDVSGTSFVGGLLGLVYTAYDDIELTNVASFGNVSGDTGVGSLIGSIFYNEDGCEDGSLTISNATVANKSGANIIGGGTYCNDDTDGENVIDPDYDLTPYLSNIKIAKDSSITLQVGINGDESSKITFDTGFQYDLSAILKDIKSDSAYNAINKFMSTLSDKATEMGAVSNRLESALDSITVNMENVMSSLSTIKDADVATTSSQYIKMQILQQASATLLATANQSPSIALQLI